MSMSEMIGMVLGFTLAGLPMDLLLLFFSSGDFERGRVVIRGKFEPRLTIAGFIAGVSLSIALAINSPIIGAAVICALIITVFVGSFSAFEFRLEMVVYLLGLTLSLVSLLISPTPLFLEWSFLIAFIAILAPLVYFPIGVLLNRNKAKRKDPAYLYEIGIRLLALLGLKQDATLLRKRYDTEYPA